MKTNLISKLTLALAISLSASTTWASEWREFWVTAHHAYFKKAIPYQVRVSFTTKGITPTYGLEEGGLVASKLFIELFTDDTRDYSPRVAISHINVGGSQLVYTVKMNFDAQNRKYWGEVSLPKSEGFISPHGQKVVYEHNPIYLKIGQKAVQQRLYIQETDSYTEFDFKLADAIR